MTISQIRSNFPYLNSGVYEKAPVYLDNAATSQRPAEVIECWDRMVAGSNANIHRAVHRMSSLATAAYEDTRDRVRAFLNASSREEIIFTSGTTASINLVAYSFGQVFVNEGDEVVVSVAEHHSNLVPWQLLCERKKARLRVLDTGPGGRLTPEGLEPLLTDRTKIVAICHISNVLGVVNPVKELVSLCHRRGIPVLVDGAQGIVHDKVDVQELDCDFYAFSGHKIYAATGTGVLYGKKKWLDEMPPFLGGGEMIESVSFEKTTYAPLPWKFEAGTQNFNSVPTLVPALDFAESVASNPEVKAEQEAIMFEIKEKAASDERIQLYSNPDIPLFSLSVKSVHHEDLALLLDKMGIAVRSGQMCAEPLMDRLGVTGLLRVSFAPYNTLEEARYFVKCLDRAIGMLI